MPYLLNFVYLLILLFLSPWLIYKTITTGKYRRGLWRKITGQALFRDGDEPCVWFHGVSVGEIHLLRQVVAAFQQKHPDWDCVISTTTDTGYTEACKRFPDLHVFYWPFDLSWAMHRALQRVNPSLVVLAEGELWPNFLSAARQRGVPVAVINGRLSPRSFRRYNLLSRLIRPMLTSVDLFAVQTEEYADCFRRLGAPAERVFVTGSVKYDGVQTDRGNTRTQELARLFGLEHRFQPDRPENMDLVWVAGSTQHPEEHIILDIYQKLRADFPGLRLFLVPRQKERFNDVARLIDQSDLPYIRRTQLPPTLDSLLTTHHSPLTAHSSTDVVLMDTIGELGALWGLADVAFVGGSLDGKRGGQNMIEPAAYGAAVVFGPHVWNFRETADRLVAGQGAIQIQDAYELEATVRRLLSHQEEREQLGRSAREFVLQQQGATARTINCLDRLLAFALQKAA
jgi:3-deoxy-D-manno-octulosonic-acid transferase